MKKNEFKIYYEAKEDLNQLINKLEFYINHSREFDCIEEKFLLKNLKILYKNYTCYFGVDNNEK